MGRITQLRTPDVRDVRLRAKAADRLRATSLGPTHPAVEAAIRWQAMRTSANSAATAVCDFRAFFEYCAARGLDPLSVTRSQARLFIAEQSSLSYAPATLARRVVLLRSYFVDLEDEGLVASNPFYRVKAGNHDPVTPTPALTMDQVSRLIEMSGARTRGGTGTVHDHRNAAMAYLMVRVGPRCEEVALATWGHIQPRGDGYEWRIHGKGNRWGAVILPPDVVAVMTDWREALEVLIDRPVRPADPLFPAIDPVSPGRVMPRRRAESLRAMERRNVSRIFTDLLRDIGLSGPRYAAHAARATAATLAYAATRDIVAVQRLLRHRNQSTTLGYIKSATTDTPAADWQPDADLPVRRARQARPATDVA